jgi:hypothetical protein
MFVRWSRSCFNRASRPTMEILVVLVVGLLIAAPIIAIVAYSRVQELAAKLNSSGMQNSRCTSTLWNSASPHWKISCRALPLQRQPVQPRLLRRSLPPCSSPVPYRLRRHFLKFRRVTRTTKRHPYPATHSTSHAAESNRRPRPLGKPHRGSLAQSHRDPSRLHRCFVFS